MSSSNWSRLLIGPHARAWSDGSHPDQAPDLVDVRLDEIIRSARLAWPTVDLAPKQFVAHLARHLPEEVPIETALGQMHTDDLYLACACALGDRNAILAFERHCFSASASASWWALRARRGSKAAAAGHDAHVRGRLHRHAAERARPVAQEVIEQRPHHVRLALRRERGVRVALRQHIGHQRQREGVSVREVERRLVPAARDSPAAQVRAALVGVEVAHRHRADEAAPARRGAEGRLVA